MFKHIYYKTKLFIYKRQKIKKSKKLKKIIIDNLNIYKDMYKKYQTKIEKSKLDFLINYGLIITNDYYTYRINDTNYFKPLKDPFLFKDWANMYIIKDVKINDLIKDYELTKELYFILKT